MNERIIDTYSKEEVKKDNKRRKIVALTGAAIVTLSGLAGCGENNKNSHPGEIVVYPESSAESSSPSDNAYNSMVSSENGEKEKAVNYPNLDQIKDEDLTLLSPTGDAEKDINSYKDIEQNLIKIMNLEINVGVNDSLAENVKKDPDYINKLVKSTADRFDHARYKENDDNSYILADGTANDEIDKLSKIHTSNLYDRLNNGGDPISFTITEQKKIGTGVCNNGALHLGFVCDFVGLSPENKIVFPPDDPNDTDGEAARVAVNEKFMENDRIRGYDFVETTKKVEGKSESILKCCEFNGDY